ncbi:DUF5954 family protein [Micromonospora sp. CPCC 206060]|uniref:DUF5954 family protein n=1 Tax=Micromonospora sp. CPCC 206060 TaxID=3122406 RepID=UPI003FA5C280
MPADMYVDSVATVHFFRTGVPTCYAVAEYVGGAWQPFSRTVATPHEAVSRLSPISGGSFRRVGD